MWAVAMPPPPMSPTLISGMEVFSSTDWWGGRSKRRKVALQPCIGDGPALCRSLVGGYDHPGQLHRPGQVVVRPGVVVDVVDPPSEGVLAVIRNRQPPVVVAERRARDAQSVAGLGVGQAAFGAEDLDRERVPTGETCLDHADLLIAIANGDDGVV